MFAEDYTQPDLPAGDAQADAADGGPVFWSGGAGQANPDEDFVQADAPESH